MTTTIADDNGLMFVLQAATASFPTGAFSHSYGFETLISLGGITDADGLGREAARWLRHGLAPADAAGVALAHEAALAGDARELARIDETLHALKLTRETREASLSTGGAFLAAILDALPGPRAAAFKRQIDDGRCAGHYATAFGVATADAGVERRTAVISFLHGSLSSLIGVAARIIPLGQIAVQRLLAQARPQVLTCADVALRTPLDELATATAGLDVASMAHERLYTRLCIS
ncbi:MAG: urease accessory UreF family protein [Burkholderiaceae bacterium]